MVLVLFMELIVFVLDVDPFSIFNKSAVWYYQRKSVDALGQFTTLTLHPYSKERLRMYQYMYTMCLDDNSSSCDLWADLLEVKIKAGNKSNTTQYIMTAVLVLLHNVQNPKIAKRSSDIYLLTA